MSNVKGKSLKQRKKEFVMHFMETKNASEAARRTGYSEKNAGNQGYRLLKDDEIQEMLASELQTLRERHLDDLESIVDAMKDEALGNIPGHTAGSRVKALELLARHFGMLEDRTSISVSHEQEWFSDMATQLTDDDKKKNHLQ
jgi:phage terminase small subunit